MSKRVGVILSGCGYLDGAEIREAILTLLALDKRDAEIVMMAPDKKQHHVVDHLTGNEVKESRNVLEEAARIARGKIQKIEEVDPSSLDAVMMPGGYGVAKNLSSFAFKGPEAEMDESVKDFLLKLHKAHKPIGAICISPAVISLLFGKEGVELTIGDDASTVSAVEALGAKHFKCSVDEIHIDKKLKIATTPAYMFDDARVKDVAVGIDKCVAAVFEMM